MGLAVIAVLAGTLGETAWSGVAAGCAISEEIDTVTFYGTVISPSIDVRFQQLAWRTPRRTYGVDLVTVAVDRVDEGEVREVEEIEVPTYPVCGIAPMAVQVGQRYRFTGERRNGMIAARSPSPVEARSSQPLPRGAEWHAPAPGFGSGRGRAWSELNPVFFGAVTSVVAGAAWWARRRRRREVVAFDHG